MFPKAFHNNSLCKMRGENRIIFGHLEKKRKKKFRQNRLLFETLIHVYSGAYKLFCQGRIFDSCISVPFGIVEIVVTQIYCQ